MSVPAQSSAAAYAAQTAANRQVSQQQRAQLSVVALHYTPAALQKAGLNAGLAWMLSDAAHRAATAPSILDPKPAPPALFYQAMARLKQNAGNYNYLMQSGGYLRDLLVVGGYSDLTQMSAYQVGQLAMQDPLIGLLSGQLTYQTTVNYITRYYTNGSATGLNAVGVLNAVGMGRTPTAAVVAQTQMVGGFGGARPAGTGSGSPFIDMLNQGVVPRL